MTIYSKEIEKAYVPRERKRIRDVLSEKRFNVRIPSGMGDEGPYEIKNAKGEIVGELRRTDAGYEIDTEDKQLKDILDGVVREIGLGITEPVQRPEVEQAATQSASVIEKQTRPELRGMKKPEVGKMIRERIDQAQQQQAPVKERKLEEPEAQRQTQATAEITERRSIEEVEAALGESQDLTKDQYEDLRSQLQEKGFEITGEGAEREIRDKNGKPVGSVTGGWQEFKQEMMAPIKIHSTNQGLTNTLKDLGVLQQQVTEGQGPKKATKI